MKAKIYKIIFCILIISIILVIGLILIKNMQSNENEKKNQEMVEVFSSVDDTQKQNLELNGYKIIGLIKIPVIDLEYPILEMDVSNPEEAKEPMRLAIIKYWGGDVNGYGNLSLAGHNNYNGTMFGKTKNLKIGDIVELTDLNNQTIQYQIYDIFKTDPNDVTILETKDETIREVTLITCTNGNRERLILKAKEL